jgi:hypothetical protein
MSEGLFKPLVGMKAAKRIHDAGFDVNLYLDHVKSKHGPVRYVGDEERRQGMTCKVTIDVRGEGLDEIIAQRDKLRELGFKTEYEYSALRLIEIL